MTAAQVDRFLRISRTALSASLDRSGKILYSSIEKLKLSPLYILGLNPGGNPRRAESSHYMIGEALQRLPNKRDNDYIDECWQGCKVPGGRPLQRRIQLLCRELSFNPADVCASNLIFLRSRDRTGSEYPESADICWPVHEEILQIVRPTLILTFESKAYEYVGMRLCGRKFRKLWQRQLDIQGIELDCINEFVDRMKQLPQLHSGDFREEQHL